MWWFLPLSHWVFITALQNIQRSTDPLLQPCTLFPVLPLFSSIVLIRNRSREICTAPLIAFSSQGPKPKPIITSSQMEPSENHHDQTSPNKRESGAKQAALWDRIWVSLIQQAKWFYRHHKESGDQQIILAPLISRTTFYSNPSVSCSDTENGLDPLSADRISWSIFEKAIQYRYFSPYEVWAMSSQTSRGCWCH